MSPPPRHEAEDYLNSHSSHGNKKKHHTPGASRLRASYLGAAEESQRIEDKSITPGVTRSIVKEGPVDNDIPSNFKQPTARDCDPGQQPLLQIAITALESQGRTTGTESPVTVSLENNSSSPAVTALKRFDEGGPRRSSNVSQHTNVAKYSIGSVIKTLLTSSDPLPTARRQSVSTSRRRSSAFRDGNRRRPKKDEAKAPLLGLGIPSTITLRKATGLFNVGAGLQPQNDDSSDESASTEGSTSNSPTAFTLVSFDSRHFGGLAQTIRSEEATQTRRQSFASSKGHELLLSTSLSRPSSRRQSLAEPVITVANTFPSPAIITSPSTGSSPVNDLERRFSVVQIRSRNSLHQVIWREDDTSSGSGTSSEHPSPTNSVKVANTLENSPVRKSATTSSNDTRQNSTIAPYKDDEPVPDSPVKHNADSLLSSPGPRSQGKMCQWSWDTNAGIHCDLADRKGALKDQKGTNVNLPQSDAPTTGSSFVPQLFIPDAEPSQLFHEPEVIRRGSFMMNSPSLTNLAAGRELGSRRSICVQPSVLSKFAGLGAAENEGLHSIGRRLSRVE
ncbi:MAG: hypothetical protein Q9170_002639 [Blastenia crenularia]